MKLWLRERDMLPACWCPWEPPATVVLGLNLITDLPPGDDVGEFWFDEEDAPNIQLNALGVEAYQKWQEADDAD